MTPFSDLFWSSPELDPSSKQAGVEKLFPAAIARSNLHRWSPGDPVSSRSKRLLIGVATYSESDMRLLDFVAEQLGQPNGTPLRIDVFSVRDCQSQQDFEKYIAGIGEVFQTPVVGVWEHGRLVEKAWGKEARDRITHLVGREHQVLQG